MTRREIAALCCRMMALIFLAWGAMYFVEMVVALSAAITNSSPYGPTSNAFWQVKSYGALGCALLLFAMALGWKAETISRWMASDDPSPVTGPLLSAEALMPVASAGVGLFAVTRALPTIFRLVAVLASGQTTLGGVWADDEWKASLGADGLLLVWGLWLILGGRGLIRIVTWARSAGKEAPITYPGESALPAVTQREEK